MSEFDNYMTAVSQQIQQNNSWSAEQAQKQMEFQERMSNTAHQREIADLKAAGLNPVLSARLGGASTPSGAMAESDASATSAMVSLMTKFLDIQADNAKAQMLAAARSAAAGSSAKAVDSNYSSDVTNVAQLFGANYNTAKAIGQLPSIVDKKLGEAGINVDSSLRKYVRGEISGVQALAGSKIGNIIKTSLNDAKDFYDLDKPAKTETGTKIKQGIKKAAQAVKNFASWLVKGKK